MSERHLPYWPQAIEKISIDHTETTGVLIDPETAAPQHGQVLRKRDIAEVIAFLWDLPCGIDLIDDRG